MYLCVLCGSENKQRLFPHTTVTNWFVITDTECVYCAVRTGSLNVILVNFVFKGVVTGFYKGGEIFRHLDINWMLYILIIVERINRLMPKI